MILRESAYQIRQKGGNTMDNKDYGFGGWGIVILIALFFLLFAGRG